LAGVCLQDVERGAHEGGKRPLASRLRPVSSKATHPPTYLPLHRGPRSRPCRSGGRSCGRLRGRRERGRRRCVSGGAPVGGVGGADALRPPPHHPHMGPSGSHDGFSGQPPPLTKRLRTYASPPGTARSPYAHAGPAAAAAASPRAAVTGSSFFGRNGKESPHASSARSRGVGRPPAPGGGSPPATRRGRRRARLWRIASGARKNTREGINRTRSSPATVESS